MRLITAWSHTHEAFYLSFIIIYYDAVHRRRISNACNLLRSSNLCQEGKHLSTRFHGGSAHLTSRAGCTQSAAVQHTTSLKTCREVLVLLAQSDKARRVPHTSSSMCIQLWQPIKSFASLPPQAPCLHPCLVNRALQNESSLVAHFWQNNQSTSTKHSTPRDQASDS